MCVDAIAGQTLYYKLPLIPFLGNLKISRINIYIPDELITTAVALLSESEATTNYVCDVMVNNCYRPQFPGKPDSFYEKKVEQCKTFYDTLPLTETTIFDINGDSVTHIDGDSKGCRNLHAFYASTNFLHCPHISFADEADANGFVKCSESKRVLPSHLFPIEILEMFKAVSSELGFEDESGIDIKFEKCPEAP